MTKYRLNARKDLSQIACLNALKSRESSEKFGIGGRSPQDRKQNEPQVLTSQDLDCNSWALLRLSSLQVTNSCRAITWAFL